MQPTSSIEAESAMALRQAQTRLSEWRERIVAARRLSADLDRGARTAAEPFLQELKDRCDHAENKMLLLRRTHEALQRGRSAVDRSFAELEDVWRSVSRALGEIPVAPNGSYRS